MHHLRDSVRHLLAAVLMAGTLTATVWTFSAGTLTLSGAWERIISIGGVALASECTAIFLALAIGDADQRIQQTRNKAIRAEVGRRRARQLRWFYAVAGTSAISGFFFRLQQLHNAPLAAFVALVPVLLVVVLAVELRPLPDDYVSIGERATARALVRLVEQSSRGLEDAIRRMGRGKTLTDEQMRQVALQASIVRVYAQPSEQHALDHALSIAAPVVEADTEPYVRTNELMGMYAISRRSAQAYMARVPGRRRVANSNAWEAPRSQVIATHGQPRSGRSGALDGAGEAQDGAYGAQVDAEQAPGSLVFARLERSSQSSRPNVHDKWCRL